MKRLPEVKLHIDIVNDNIVDDRADETCRGSCGFDWSSAENLNTVRQQVLERFGDKIDISYTDLSKTADITDIKAIKELSSEITMPVLLVNNRLRIAGGFDSRQLMDVIEVELEAGMV